MGKQTKRINMRVFALFLCLLLQIARSTGITIKTSDNVILSMNANVLVTTVGEVKAFVAEHTNENVDRLILENDRDVLTSNDRTLAYYEIVSHSQLRVFIRYVR